jgi:acyl dehydratase
MAAHSFTRSHGPATSELFVRFATLLNDFNPAHYDLDFAHEVGLPGVIGPGTLLQGWLLADVESELEHPTAATDTPHSSREIDLRLKAPYLVGDTVDIEYTVEDDQVAAVLTATAPEGEPRRIATATIRVETTERKLA